VKKNICIELFKILTLNSCTERFPSGAEAPLGRSQTVPYLSVEGVFWNGLRGVSSKRHAPHRVHGSPEPYMVQDKSKIVISMKNFSGKVSVAFRVGAL